MPNSLILAYQTSYMIWLYIFLIVLAAFPLFLTIYRMRSTAYIKKNGMHVNATVKQIKTLRGKNTVDLLLLEYKERATGRVYDAKATVSHQKYNIGDTLPVAYLPDKPSKYAIALKNAYWALLIFCIALFLFIIFAVYKLNEMTTVGSM
jgi:hypothetical protein